MVYYIIIIIIIITIIIIIILLTKCTTIINVFYIQTSLDHYITWKTAQIYTNLFQYYT